MSTNRLLAWNVRAVVSASALAGRGAKSPSGALSSRSSWARNTSLRSANPTRRLLSTSFPRLRPAGNTSTDASPPSGPTRLCPACNAAVPLAASPCPHCRALLAIPAQLTHHALFGLCEPSASEDAGAGAERSGVDELRALPGGGFEVDARELRARFLRRQQGVHPDSFASQGEVGGRAVMLEGRRVVDPKLDGTAGLQRMRSLAETQSSLLNKAYSTLLDPLSRAQYLVRGPQTPFLGLLSRALTFAASRPP